MREWLSWIALGVLSAGLFGASEERRIGLIGPESSADPGWVALQLGMREALAVYARESFEARFTVAEVRAESGVAGTLDELAAQDVDAIILMHPGAADLDPGNLPRGPRLYYVEWAPEEGAGEVWKVDWTAWARAVCIVTADLADAPRGGAIGLHELERRLPPAGREALQASEGWPATGAWSMRPVPATVTPDFDRRIDVIVTGDPRLLLRQDAARRMKTVAVWLDALVLQSLAEGRIEAAVMPHWVEAGGAVIDRIMEGRTEGPAAVATRRIDPLILSSENAAAWREFWVTWQF